MMSYKIEDTEQTKRMKGLAIGGAYFNCGEIYKLLEYSELHRLVKKIKKGTIKLKSNLIYHKMEITNEEKFLENLDHYITYIKDNYHLGCVEQFLLLEMGLDNKYADQCLLLLNDFHSDENYNQYFNYFRRMFSYNIFNNIKYFHSKDKNKEFRAINKAYNDIKNLDFDSDKDILVIERMIIDIIRFRNNNLCNAFDSYKKIQRKEELEFYFTQLEWVLTDYYTNIKEEKYVFKNTDNVITSGKTKVLFNICDDIKKLNKNNCIIVEFGIFNQYFNSKIKIDIFRKYEFDKLFDVLENIVVKKKRYRERFVFIDATLEFIFNYDKEDIYLDLKYQIPNSGDDYIIYMGRKDIINLYNIIKKQIN